MSKRPVCSCAANAAETRRNCAQSVRSIVVMYRLSDRATYDISRAERSPISAAGDRVRSSTSSQGEKGRIARSSARYAAKPDLAVIRVNRWSDSRANTRDKATRGNVVNRNVPSVLARLYD